VGAGCWDSVPKSAENVVVMTYESIEAIHQHSDDEPLPVAALPLVPEEIRRWTPVLTSSVMRIISLENTHEAFYYKMKTHTGMYGGDGEATNDDSTLVT
jgi:hypothetical protein